MRIKLSVMAWVIAVLVISDVTYAQNLLTNGNFSVEGTNTQHAAGWDEFNSVPGGWNNRETNANGPYGDTTNYHYAVGASGTHTAYVWQDVSVADDGSTYVLSADASLDTWWLNTGSIKIEFYDAVTSQVGFTETVSWSQPNYDVGVPWANYSVTNTAPSGTAFVRVILQGNGEGGTARFDNAELETYDPVLDTDGDGLPNYWEIEYGLDPFDNGTTNINNGPVGDPDSDTLVNSNEFALGTNPVEPDTDFDGLDDDEEVNTTSTDPTVADSDGDFLLDGAEVTNHLTNPLLVDTDSDDVNDATEVYAGSDPLSGASVPANALPDVIGLESFYYNNGAFNGATGGELFDYDNSVINDLYTGHTGASSAWSASWGTSYITAGRLETKESGMLRPLNGAATGGAGIALFAQKVLSPEVDAEVIYARVDMTFEEGVTWGGLSLYATDEEEIFFGVSGDVSGTNTVFKIEESGLGSVDSVITPLAGATYTMVIAMDATFGEYSLWLNPNLAALPSPDISMSALDPSNLRLDAVRLASGGTGAIYWDNLVIGTTAASLLTGSSDTDNDGLPDAWEVNYELDPLDDGTISVTNGPVGDPDSDTLVNSNEFTLGTDPTNADTDYDGLSDDQEVNVTLSDPLVWDTDGDGLNDGDEVTNHLTNPLLADSDSDGEDDWFELFQGTNPTNALSSSASEGIPIVDGMLDAAYGAASATQTVNTAWVDNQDELDAAYALVKNDRLYLLFTGNMNYSWNKLTIFIDSSDAVTANVFTSAGVDSSSNMDGLTFDSGFSPDYHLMCRIGGDAGSFGMATDFADLSVSNTSWHWSPSENASGSITYMGAGDASSNVIVLGLINTNALGVVSDPAGSAAYQADALAVATGFECSIALADLGNPSGTIRVMALIASEDHTMLSNQLLPGLPSPPQLALGTASAVDFSAIAGEQFFRVNVHGGLAGSPVILSGQLIAGNTLFELNVSKLAVSSPYKVQETDDLASGFIDVPGSDWTASATNEVVTVPADTGANPVMFYQVVAP